MSQTRVLLVGAGPMAIAYHDVLVDDDRDVRVAGRGEASAAAFELATGVAPGTGPLEEQLTREDVSDRVAIVAVNAMHLATVSTTLIEHGVRRLLVEKPAGLDRGELEALADAADAGGAEIAIGYNRRYGEAVRVAREMIADDGGPLSVTFDFSEPSRRIAGLAKPQRELDTWFYGNSSHVVDLALHFSGALIDPTAMTAGGVDWHRDAGVFVGHASSESGALVSWHANWMGPGRWGVEVVTRERRLILQPLEQLRVQDHNSFAEHDVALDDELDRRFKPGLMRQTRAFLDGIDDDHLARLSEHRRRFDSFEAVRTGERRMH